MIPFELAFVRAESAREAVESWSEAVAAGQRPLYYGGGTEFVTMARENKRHADLLIDYKALPEAAAHGEGSTPGRVSWGAALRLNTVIDTGLSGLVARCARGVADRTVRNSITLGGNILGMLPYREAVLPFLLLDGTVRTIAPASGTGVERPAITESPVAARFDKRLLLGEGELALEFSLDAAVLSGLESDGITDRDRGWGPVEAYSRGPRGGWYYTRRTREPRLDYPLVTLVAALLDGQFRLALSGAFGYPLRAHKAEELLNAAGMKTVAEMTDSARGELAAAAIDAEGLQFKKDLRGGREYRRELTVRSVEAALLQLTGDAS